MSRGAASSPDFRRRPSLDRIEQDRSTHAGLWLDRFASGTREDGLRTLLEEAASIREPVGYEHALRRRKEVLGAHAAGFEEGRTIVWEEATRGRLLAGVGEASVREVGISLQRTWGMPVIPGSSLKGVAKAHAGALAGADAAAQRFVVELFGTSEGPDAAAGLAVVHDAWWVPSKAGGPLAVDVLTPHHPRYTKGEAPPMDWDDPNPVAFVSAHGLFQFAVSGPPNWVEKAKELLREALAVRGVGAKTRAGYGGFGEPPPTVLQLAAVEKEKELRATQAIAPIVHGFRGAPNLWETLRALRSLHERDAALAVEAWLQLLQKQKRDFWKDRKKKGSVKGYEAEYQLMCRLLDEVK